MAYGRSHRGGEGERDGGAVQRQLPGPGKRTLTEMAFPHAATIQSAVGPEIPGSAVHDAAACESGGVQAFTDGSVSSFASESPTLHVAAHDAAHQLQHAGLTNDGGMGADATRTRSPMRSPAAATRGP